MKPLILPEGANVPAEWIVRRTLFENVIVVPSWSMKDGATHNVSMDLSTRVLSCDCPGFQFRGVCHHVRGLAWFCSKPGRRRGVQVTSILSYRALKDVIGDRQITVLDVLERSEEPLSDKQIAAALKWPINCVTPRRGELVEMGLVESAGHRFDSGTNRHEYVWEATN